MATYSYANKKELLGLANNYSHTQNKKIKHYSYSTYDQIGKGFSSIVYRGTNQETNEIVAIKCIDMKGVKDSISRQMLDCEIQALKTIKHANILKCFEVFKQTSHCYIVTQYCNEGDLSNYLKKKRKLSQQDLLPILKDIVQGFVEIADNKFLHRDLKLANIFLNNGRAKIADFGFAKKNKNSVAERQKYNVGSPLYMSPQALKKNIYSVKNDIWSIGVMAYELLHGQTPWQCRTQKQLMDKMVKVPVRFKQSLKISDNIKQFIKKCLEIDESKRMDVDNLKEWLNTGKLGIKLPTLQLQSLKLSSDKQNTTRQSLQYRPLNEVTNCLTNRTNKQFFNKINAKQNKDISIKNILPKAVIDKNNTIVINEINKFRILFKIIQKLKKQYSQQKDLLNTIGNEVIRRVTNLKNCFIDNSNISQYDLKQPETYLAEDKNHAIKKYKSVISQYFRKYTTELSVTPFNKYTVKNINESLTTFLKKTNELATSEDLLVRYWMVEYINLPKDIKKQYLDSVIEPKIKLTKQYIQQRIKQIV